MKHEESKNTTPKLALEEYLFAGGGEFEPITIRATSIQEATELWEKQKVAIGATKSLSIEN